MGWEQWGSWNKAWEVVQAALTWWEALVMGQRMERKNVWRKKLFCRSSYQESWFLSGFGECWLHILPPKPISGCSVILGKSLSLPEPVSSSVALRVWTVLLYSLQFMHSLKPGRRRPRELEGPALLLIHCHPAYGQENPQWVSRPQPCWG